MIVYYMSPNAKELAQLIYLNLCASFSSLSKLFASNGNDVSLFEAYWLSYAVLFGDVLLRLAKGLSLIVKIVVHRSGIGLEVSMGKVVELRRKFTEKDVVWDGEEKMWRHDFRIPPGSSG